MKRVAIIGTVGVPSRYGGFETLVHQLVQQLSSKVDFKIYCSGKVYKKQDRIKYFQGARLYYLPLSANGIQSVLYDMVSMIHALFVADTFLILGVSGGLLVPFLRIFTRKKIIVNIDGLEWRREKWSPFARWFLKFSERVAVKWSHADITDNEAIKRYTSIQYKTLSHLIEYGGDHVMRVAASDQDLKKYPFLNGPYVFKVARIEPENNVHMILEAFNKISYTLVIIGNWNNSDYGRSLKKNYGDAKNINLLDPIYDQRELDLLRGNCSLYVHGHSAGGTNPSLVEAMYLGLPVVAFDCSYNVATTKNKALYFRSAQQLISKINQIDETQLRMMRVEMGKIAAQRYTWSIIAAKYHLLIQAVANNRQKHNIHSDLSNLDNNILQKEGIAHLKAPAYYYQDL